MNAHASHGAVQAAVASFMAFSVGGVVPLLGAIFILDPRARLLTVSVTIRC
jgi:VIT1/CCC1 family predicted Fe2+/Mn2+ transporter